METLARVVIADIVARSPSRSLSVDLERLEPQELGNRLSEIALETALRLRRRRLSLPLQ